MLLLALGSGGLEVLGVDAGAPRAAEKAFIAWALWDVQVGDTAAAAIGHAYCRGVWCWVFFFFMYSP